MYHRQVTSRPRSVEAIMSSSDAVPPPSRTRLLVNRRSSAPVFAAHARVRMRLASVPRLIHSVAATGAPLSKTDCRPASDAVTISNGEHCSPGSAGSERVGEQLRQLLAHARPAIGTGEDIAPLLGVAGGRRPVRVDHQVGDRPGWQQRLVPAGRQVELRRRPVQARSEEHTSELQSRRDLVCRLLLEKKKKNTTRAYIRYTENRTQSTS